MTPETHYSVAEKMESSDVEKDRGRSIHGKQHASKSNNDGGSNYVYPKKSNKVLMQHSDHVLSQPDLPDASKRNRGRGDPVWHTANRTSKSGGRGSTRDKTYAYKHQGFTTEPKMTSADKQTQSRNGSTNKYQVEENPNSLFQKNTGQSRQFGREQKSQGGWGISTQENMHHHHQRPPSNRDRQKQNLHYEYKPVGSHANDGGRNEEQLKESSHTEGPRYREKGHVQQRHVGYQQQKGYC